MYDNDDYIEALKFACNYPEDLVLLEYDTDRDMFVIEVYENGYWYDPLSLEGDFIRKCLNYKGIKRWI